MTSHEKLLEKLNTLNKTIMEEIQRDIHIYGLGDEDIFTELRKIYLKDAKKCQESTKTKYRQMDLEECIEIEKAHQEKLNNDGK